MHAKYRDYDILLVNPNSFLGRGIFSSNTGLASIEAFLRHHGIRCKSVHLSEIDSFIDKADVFGISVMDHSYGNASELTRRLHDKTVVWGGWTATALPEYVLLENPGVDYVILQEGEQRLSDLLRSLEQPELFDRIDGIAYRRADEIVVRPPNRFVNLDELPIPTDLAVFNGLVFVELSRGCYGNCGYCQENPKMRFKSAHKVAAEIEHWYDKGRRKFYLGDANAMANGPLLRNVAVEIEKRQLAVELLLTGRPNDILRHRDILESLFKSDFIRLHSLEVGVEANSQNALDLLGRRSTPELNRQALEVLLELRARHSPETAVHANMILFPHFDMTLADFVESVRFIGDYECSRDVLGLQLYGLAATPIWHEMNARGFETRKELGLRIIDYVFTDPDVDRLFDKLVRIPLEQDRRKRNTLLGRRELQHQCHDLLLEFHRSPDIM
jgi:radical SAM superfamily enzyme YgiQ (UPF0313 family)